MKNKAIILSTGLAMFSMFFGSGNLVFPLVVGQLSEGHYLMAALGILLTGVVVPFLGILAMLLFNGDQSQFFARLGKPAAFLIPLLCLSIMGPFGVEARCMTVAHGAFRMLLPALPLWMFSAFFSLIVFLLTIRKSKIVPILGSALTPLLLASLAAIVWFSIRSVDLPAVLPTQGVPQGIPWKSFFHGIFQGYQTMDLLAAFFFSVFVIKHLQKKTQSNPASTLPIFLKASFLGAGLLAAIYFFLVLMGAMYSSGLASVPPEEMLGFVAKQSLGPIATPIVCTTVALACLTTAVVLASLYADFLRKEVFKGRLPQWAALLATVAIAFFVSTLEFSGIANFITPILSVCYPAFIVLAVLSIFQKLWGWRALRVPTAAALSAKFLVDFLS